MKFARYNVVQMAFAISYSLFTINYSLATEPPAALTPYTFLGRVMDSTHVAFDGDRTATIEVSDEQGKLLSRTATFTRADSRRNYALVVPMATSPANGCAVQNAALEIDVTDDLGKVWSGVVVDAAAGAPGGVREVDIVLGEDQDGDGIDDQLYRRLKAEWERSEYWKAGETFDPTKDHDGDGISTIAEALAGTNPYDPEDVFRITAFSYSSSAALAFNAVGGRSYTVVEAHSLSAKDWKTREFFLPDSDVPANVLSVPSGSRSSSSTVYLLPSGTNAFFRVRVE